MIELRGHHLLCTSLFQGSGYSEEFVKRMTEVVEKCIPNEEIRLITGMDHVCEKCPNKQEDNTCRLGNRDVLMKDEKTLEYAGFAKGQICRQKELLEGIRRIGKEQFEEICGTCRWCKMGYCSYEVLHNFCENKRRKL